MSGIRENSGFGWGKENISLLAKPRMARGSEQRKRLIMATVNHCILSQLSKLARLEAEMSRNIDFYALLAPEMAGIAFVAFDQQP